MAAGRRSEWEQMLGNLWTHAAQVMAEVRGTGGMGRTAAPNLAEHELACQFLGRQDSDYMDITNQMVRSERYSRR
jgi:hypothetical protein